MKITKESGKIILELSPEEDEIIEYFIRTRDTGVLHEYFDFWMNGRRETKLLEESQSIIERFKNLSKEDKERFLKGEWFNGRLESSKPS